MTHRPQGGTHHQPGSLLDENHGSILSGNQHYLAESHADAVWKHFARRLEAKPEGGERYEAIPFRFFGLETILSRDANLGVATVFSWYREDDPLFRFNGGRLLSAMFPAFAPPFAAALLSMAVNGADSVVQFILAILENYRGEPAVHDVLKALVHRIPEDDRRLVAVGIALDNTGVVSGESGFVEAYRAKKALMASWLDDDRPKVRQFAERHARQLDQRIAAEQRTSEQRRELRNLDFDDGEDDGA